MLSNLDKNTLEYFKSNGLNFTKPKEQKLGLEVFFELPEMNNDTWREYLQEKNPKKNIFSYLRTNYIQQPKDIGILKQEEYDLIVEVYHIFVESFKKGDWENFLKKTVATIQNELAFFVKNFWVRYEKFLKDIEIDEVILSLTFKNKLLKAQEQFDKTHINGSKKKNSINSFSDFMENEINWKYSHKVKTEILFKILLYIWDDKSFALALFNKIDGILNNTHLKISINEKNTYDEMRNILVFETIRGMKPYREKLLSGYGHTSKIMSYMDRIARNVCLTNNQRLANDSFEMYGLITESDASSDDTRGDDIAEFSNKYMEEMERNVETIKEETFYSFSYWKYLLKFVSNNSTILDNHLIKLHHTMKLDIWEHWNYLNIVLNQQGFYFFDKEQKKYNVYWKIIHSYFDLVFYLLKYKHLTPTQVRDFLFDTPTLKFAVLSLEWDNIGEIYFYEIKGTDISEIIKESQFKYFKEYKKKVIQLIDCLAKDSSAVKQERTLVKLYGEFYKFIAMVEKIFIEDIYDQLFNDHNVAYIFKLIQKHLSLSWKQYMQYLNEMSDESHRIEDVLLRARKYKDNNKAIYSLLKNNFYEWYRSLENTNAKELSEHDKFLRIVIRKHFPRLKESALNKEEYENQIWMPGWRQYAKIFFKLRLLLDDEGQNQFKLYKNNIMWRIEDFGNEYNEIANENNIFYTEEELENKTRMLSSLKKKNKSIYWYGFKQSKQLSEKDIQTLSDYGLLDLDDENDDIFLSSSRFYWAIQYLL